MAIMYWVPDEVIAVLFCVLFEEWMDAKTLILTVTLKEVKLL